MVCEAVVYLKETLSGIGDARVAPHGEQVMLPSGLLVSEAFRTVSSLRALSLLWLSVFDSSPFANSSERFADNPDGVNP